MMRISQIRRIWRRSLYFRILTFAGAFTLLQMIWVIPPHEKYFFWHGLIQSITSLFLGFFQLVLFLFATRASLAIYVLALAVFSLIMSLWLYYWWKSRWPMKLLLLLPVPVNLCFGIYFALLTFVPPGAFYASCKYLISDTNSIRMNAYQQGPNSRFFAALTDNSGKAKQQIMSYPFEGHRFPPTCETIRVLDEAVFWLWLGHELSVTTDGGKTWYRWDPSETWPGLSHLVFGRILDVQFEDPQSGRMVIRQPRFNQLTRDRILITNDGGLTWHEESDNSN